VNIVLQRIVGVEAEKNFYESQLIILDTLEKVLNSVRIFELHTNDIFGYQVKWRGFHKKFGYCWRTVW